MVRRSMRGRAAKIRRKYPVEFLDRWKKRPKESNLDILTRWQEEILKKRQSELNDD